MKIQFLIFVLVLCHFKGVISQMNTGGKNATSATNANNTTNGMNTNNNNGNMTVGDPGGMTMEPTTVAPVASNLDSKIQQILDKERDTHKGNTGRDHEYLDELAKLTEALGKPSKAQETALAKYARFVQQRINLDKAIVQQISVLKTELQDDDLEDDEIENFQKNIKLLEMLAYEGTILGQTFLYVLKYTGSADMEYEMDLMPPTDPNVLINELYQLIMKIQKLLADEDDDDDNGGFFGIFNFGNNGMFDISNVLPNGMNSILNLNP